MRSEEDHVPDLIPLISSRRLGSVALTLFILYVVILLGSALPLALLEPSWQLRQIGTLIHASIFPLVGLALLHLAADLAPNDRRMQQRRLFFERVAILAVLGFALAIPLHTYDSWERQKTTAAEQAGELSKANRQLASLRLAVQEASSSEDLQRRLADLRGPALGEAERRQSLPKLKARLNAGFDMEQDKLNRQVMASTGGGPWQVLQETIRNALACVTLALGFAALSRRPGSGFSLLREGQNIWAGNRPSRGKRPAHPL